MLIKGVGDVLVGYGKDFIRDGIANQSLVVLLLRMLNKVWNLPIVLEVVVVHFEGHRETDNLRALAKAMKKETGERREAAGHGHGREK